jgi:hypothetical protein
MSHSVGSNLVWRNNLRVIDVPLAITKCHSEVVPTLCSKDSTICETGCVTQEVRYNMVGQSICQRCRGHVLLNTALVHFV